MTAGTWTSNVAWMPSDDHHQAPGHSKSPQLLVYRLLPDQHVSLKGLCRLKQTLDLTDELLHLLQTLNAYASRGSPAWLKSMVLFEDESWDAAVLDQLCAAADGRVSSSRALPVFAEANSRPKDDAARPLQNARHDIQAPANSAGHQTRTASPSLPQVQGLSKAEAGISRFKNPLVPPGSSVRQLLTENGKGRSPWLKQPKSLAHSSEPPQQPHGKDSPSAQQCNSSPHAACTVASEPGAKHVQPGCQTPIQQGSGGPEIALGKPCSARRIISANPAPLQYIADAATVPKPCPPAYPPAQRPLQIGPSGLINWQSAAPVGAPLHQATPLPLSPSLASSSRDVHQHHGHQLHQAATTKPGSQPPTRPPAGPPSNPTFQQPGLAPSSGSAAGKPQAAPALPQLPPVQAPAAVPSGSAPVASQAVRTLPHQSAADVMQPISAGGKPVAARGQAMLPSTRNGGMAEATCGTGVFADDDDMGMLAAIDGDALQSASAAPRHAGNHHLPAGWTLPAGSRGNGATLASFSAPGPMGKTAPWQLPQQQPGNAPQGNINSNHVPYGAALPRQHLQQQRGSSGSSGTSSHVAYTAQQQHFQQHSSAGGPHSSSHAEHDALDKQDASSYAANLGSNMPAALLGHHQQQQQHQFQSGAPNAGPFDQMPSGPQSTPAFRQTDRVPLPSGPASWPGGIAKPGNNHQEGCNSMASCFTGNNMHPADAHRALREVSLQHAPQHQTGPGVLIQVKVLLGAPGFAELAMPYHFALPPILRRHGGSWLPAGKVWQVPSANLQAALKDLASAPGLRVEVEDMHPITDKIMQATRAQPDDSELYDKLPKKLAENLMPFQRAGVQFALQRGGRVLIGDEMGLGKTVQAVALLACYRADWPALIITPSSLREQWADALHSWLGITDQHIHIVHTSGDCRFRARQPKFVITSYNFLGKLKEDIETRDYRIVVVDESHYIKDWKAQRSKDTVPVLQRAERAILLTGTPALARPKELFNQISALLPAAKLKMKDYGERYCAGGNSKFDKYCGASNHEELYRLLTSTIMVRRLKQQVLKQLPAKRRQQVFLRLDAGGQQQLKALSKQLQSGRDAIAQAEDAADGGSGVLSSLKAEERKAIMEFYMTSAEAKVKAVQDYVTDMLENDQKFLIFAHHKCLLNGIESAVRTKCRAEGKKAKAPFIRIDGDTPPSERQRLVNDFQQQAGMKVAILSIKAAGTGLTLTAASIVVFAELAWTPGDIVQAEDRAHRIGQASSVNVYYLHVRGSIDDLIWSSCQNKLQNVGQVLDGERDSLDVTTAQLSQPGPGQSTLNGYIRQQPVPAGMGATSSAAGQVTMTSYLKPASGQSNATAVQKRPLPDPENASIPPSKLMRR
ncbi:hypothetical protein WJX74_004176 [Apatococcus lobatus]|uniref:Uncharacterized protein n=1 Tax=Apatococcus lobatus TaxID=904363 RepID=A0AAW1SFX7_9CHLO